MRVAGPSSLERGLGGWNLLRRSDGTKVRVWSEAGGGAYFWSAGLDDGPSTVWEATRPGAVPVALVGAGRRWALLLSLIPAVDRTQGVPLRDPSAPAA